MRTRPIKIIRPELEQLEAKQLLSVSGVPIHAAHRSEKVHALAVTSAVADHKQPTKFLAFRVTNTPHQTPYSLVPPFPQVLVQSTEPVRGQVYNVLQIALKNGTAQTFTAGAGFKVKLSTQKRWLPILTGNEVWKPRQVMVFYVLTKRYYPLPEVSGGFQFDLGARYQHWCRGRRGFFSE